jgi:hypothetical protein
MITHISKLPLLLLLLLLLLSSSSSIAAVVLFFFTFMQSSYNYMPETNDVSMVYGVSDIM